MVAVVWTNGKNWTMVKKKSEIFNDKTVGIHFEFWCRRIQSMYSYSDSYSCGLGISSIIIHKL
ncbi:hypothetical protein DERP_008058 [Dermatophagoides pteronyssinus]|uniref:Uncharacterized protein n=1 Tax=Dermatophagoides pteronyssinus TaxID=6956 RepID=A0ABQ8JJL4_DERPT|nr:hypothetical protein DERP_008058 [Dermatophagoides pteronyssinus]